MTQFFFIQDLPFEDGAAPPFDIIKKWMEVVCQLSDEDQGGCIAVHCVAGLGRAPVLVAIALIEHGLKYHVAVEKIREYVVLMLYLDMSYLYSMHPSCRGWVCVYCSRPFVWWVCFIWK